MIDCNRARSGNMSEQRKQTDRDHVLAALEAERVRFVNLEFTDVVGMAKCVTIPVEQFPDCLTHGKWFDGSALEGFARIAESDMYLFPDLATFSIVPGSVRPQPAGSFTDQIHDEDVIARIICNVHTPDGERFDGDPRATLANALQLAKSMDYSFLVAPELEFFLLQMEDKTPTPLPHDLGGYFDLSTDLAAAVRRQMVQTLQQMHITIESSHHEVAAGQHELDFESGDALSIADGLMTAKYVLKSIAEYGLSDIGRYFIAGQLAHARAMCAILAPLVNSYKRLVHGFEAPVFVNWGRVNREALIRVPRPSVNRQLSARIELRCCDPSCNPYLALAVMLRTGLDGIQRKLTLPAAMDESLFLRDENERLQRHARLLPATLGEALEGLREDSLVRETLGDSIYEGFLDAKSIEWSEYRRQVHTWEIERYLPVF